MSSSFNLRQLNLWLGMARGDHALPRDLFDLGYRDEVIERAFPNSEMDQVCPELIMASRSRGHALVFEFKSGPNTDADQLRRYAGIQSDDLHRAWVAPEGARTHDVVVIGKEEHEDRLQIGIRADAHPFPVLVADDGGLRTSLNAFSDDATDACLNPRLDVNWGAVPTSYVPFDQDSEGWEVAESTIPEVLSAMLRRERRLEFKQICQSLTPWGIMGQPGRQQLEAKVAAVLQDAAANEFEDYFTCDASGIRMDWNPLDLGTDKRSASYRKLKRLLEDFIERLRDGGGQLRLDLTE